MAASAVNVLDTVLGVGEDIYKRCCGGRSTGNVLDNVLGVGEERFEKVLRWPPPPATCSTLCLESGRRSTKR